MRWISLTPLLLVSTLASWPASAQPAGQVWTNLTYDWLSSARLSYEIDFEPKGQLVAGAGQPLWANLDITPNVEYAAGTWIDLVGEVVTGYTDQTDAKNTFELSPRAGIRLHIISRLLRARDARPGADREKQPKRRGVFSTLLRLEQRNQFYSDGSSTKSTWRFRDRFEFAYPLNRPKVTIDGAVYVIADAEAFVPIGEDTKGLVNQLRMRSGVGYRSSFDWRFDALYMWTAAKSPASGAFASDNHAIDIRVKRVF